MILTDLENKFNIVMDNFSKVINIFSEGLKNENENIRDSNYHLIKEAISLYESSVLNKSYNDFTIEELEEIDDSLSDIY